MKPFQSTVALAIVLMTSAARADFATATFEDVPVGASGVRADFRPDNAFTSGGFTFNNDYTPDFGGFFNAFAVSTKIDNVLVNSPGTSQDFNHQFGAYAPQPTGAPGTGSGGSATYSVAYSSDFGPAIINLPDGYEAYAIDIANTTYVASSVQFGDAFSRPFRAGDFLRLDVFGYSEAGATGSVIDTVSISLADFSGATLNLLDHFQTLDLTALKGSKSLTFRLDTNVENSFGPSVPTQFAVDNVVAVRSVPEPSAIALVLVGAGLVAVVRRRRA